MKYLNAALFLESYILMGLIAKDLPALVLLVLPGFISAGVYYTLTAHPKTSEFERIVQSLIFTTFVQIGLILIKPILFFFSRWWALGNWTTNIELVWSVVIAIIIGLIFAVVSNKNLFHKFFQRLEWSSRTSYPSEWYAAFTEHKNTYVLLHLDGSRRIRGWPDQWPDQSDKGFFILAEAEWVLDDAVFEDQIAPLHHTKRILIPAAEVKMVEFLWPADDDEPASQRSNLNAPLVQISQADTKGENHGS